MYSNFKKIRKGGNITRFFLLISLFFVYVLNCNADCPTCDYTLNSNSNNYTFLSGTTCVEGTPTLESSVTFASGASICVKSDATLKFSNVNNFTFNDPASTVTLDIYGTLSIEGNPAWTGNMNIYIHSGGQLLMPGKTLILNASAINITNDGTFKVGTLTSQTAGSTVTIVNNSTMIVDQTINMNSGTSLYFSNEGTLTVTNNFNSSSTSVYVNCGTFNGTFNMNNGSKIINTGTFNTSQLDFGGSASSIENYGIFTSSGSINAPGPIYNEGVFEFTSGQLSGDGDLKGPSDSSKRGYFKWSGKNGKNKGTIGPNLNFINSSGTSDFASMFNGSISNYTWIDPNYFEGDTGWTGTLPTLPATTCPNPNGTPATPIPTSSTACTPVNLTNLQPTESNVTYEWWTGTSTTRTSQITGASLTNYTTEGTVYLWAKSNTDATLYSPEGAAVDVSNCENYWIGTTSTDWNTSSNWTANKVPLTGEDVEFATVDNNNGNPAVNDLYLDQDRVIGNLINASDKNLVVTTGNQLTINGTVQDDNSSAGTIVIKSATDQPTGTLLFANPANNPNVGATVEFYNKGYQCQTCGYYKQQWQYFGIPVSSASFPSTGAETVNQYVEPWNGNKWRPAPYTPDTQLKAFKGYEITNSSTSVPTNMYNFTGTLNVSDATLTLTKTTGVNYTGTNLFSNSYTAALPITASAITGSGFTGPTVYLFNAGTRDQWRKLSGNTVTGIESGRYLAVPFAQAGQGGLPDLIPSMHSFMLMASSNGGTATLKYDQLTKNALVNSVAWRSTESRDNTMETHPGIIMEVIGSRSADKVWVFEESGTTRGFDSGWDGYKIDESPLMAIYGKDEEGAKYQVMTIPAFEGTKIGVTKEDNEGYTIGISATSEVSARGLYLVDRLTGRSYPIVNGSEYRITGSNVSDDNRFEIAASPTALTKQAASDNQVRITVTDEAIVMDNQTGDHLQATIVDVMGRVAVRKEIPAMSTVYYTEKSSMSKGVYVAKVVDEAGKIVKTERILMK